MVTIGLGSKIFSSGFDIKQKLQDNQRIDLAFSMQNLLGRIMSLPMPTMCAFNGHAVAGGLFLGLAHDFRALKDKAFVSLSEIMIGVGMGPAWTQLLRHKLQP